MRSSLSIFLALIITFLLNVVLTNVVSLEGLLFYVIYVLGGGIATWYSTDGKIRYAVYYGIISALIFGFFLHNLIVALILVPILAGIGGFTAKKIREEDIKMS